MRFTFNWLKDYLVTQMNHIQICDFLNRIGFEVESCVDLRDKYSDIVIAYVESAEPHPNATKLKVCKVFDGKEYLQIVCGASNVCAGMKVPLAKIGANVNGSEIVRAELRGIMSEGMICSESELGVTDESEGIMSFDEDAVIGKSFVEHYFENDIVLEIALMPNRRQDCASVRGIARDLAAAGAGSFRDRKDSEINFDLIRDDLSIEMKEGVACSEVFFCRLELSEQYVATNSIRRRMKAIGEEHDLDLVNLSNYMMYDMGRPNHFYDFDKISGKICIRKSTSAERFKALNDTEYTLPEGLTVISDDEKILGLAGVIGGESSKVSDGTRNVLIEIANFDSSAVMKSGREMMIHTDSRMRFESGLERSMMRRTMSNFLTALSGNTVAYKLIEAKDEMDSSITFRYSFISDFIGHKFSKEYIDDVLNKLGFTLMSSTDEEACVTVPQWRSRDIFTEQDLAEEVVRIYGIDRIQPIRIATNDYAEVYKHSSNAKLHKIKDLLNARGLSEAISWSFYDREVAKRFGNDICITNPISESMCIMRGSILPQLLDIVKRAIFRGESDILLFEIGNVYKGEFKQNTSIAGIRIGSSSCHSIHAKKRPWDFYDVREDVAALIQCLGLSEKSVRRADVNYLHPGRSAEIEFGVNSVAYCGEFHPEVLAEFDIEKNVVCFEILLSDDEATKAESLASERKFSKYQISKRDLAFIVSHDVEAARVLDAAFKADTQYLKDVQIFDIYCVNEMVKSVALTLRLQSDFGTLQDEDIQADVNAVIISMMKNVDGKLRDA